MTEQERSYLNRLLHADFPGREELIRQLAEARVRTIDENGSLEILVRGGPPAEVKRRIPVEGQFADADGVPIHILLHAPNGFASELEVYREDSSRVIAMPSADRLELLVLP
jgi:hypothetical protein